MKNYTTIEIDGKPVGLKFGLPAVRQIFERTIKNKLEEDDGNYGPYGMAQVLFAGYQNNCLVKEVDETLTFEDFSDFVDEQYVARDLDQIIAAVNVFTGSTIVKGLNESAKKKIQQESQQIESQNQLIGTESKVSAMVNSD